ncbi:hypothetical protein GN956_G23092 [Arapaima gigas]
MGSQNSRPKVTRVAPSDSRAQTREGQEEGQTRQCTTNWSTELQEEQQGTVCMSRVTKLPPLKPLIFSPHTADPLPDCHSSNMRQSIIRSHPPRRTQLLQPLVQPEADIVFGGSSNSKAQECRVGAFHCSSTHSQGRCYGMDSLQQVLRLESALNARETLTEWCILTGGACLLWGGLCLALAVRRSHMPGACVGKTAGKQQASSPGIPKELITVLVEWKEGQPATMVVPHREPANMGQNVGLNLRRRRQPLIN